MENYKDDIFEPWNLEDGDLDDVKSRALAIASFVLDYCEPVRSRANELGEEVYESDDKADIIDSMRSAIRLLLENQTSVEKDDDAWLSLYIALFDSSPFAYESSYTPEKGELGELTKGVHPKKGTGQCDLARWLHCLMESFDSVRNEGEPMTKIVASGVPEKYKALGEIRVTVEGTGTEIQKVTFEEKCNELVADAPRPELLFEEDMKNGPARPLHTEPETMRRALFVLYEWFGEENSCWIKEPEHVKIVEGEVESMPSEPGVIY